LAKISELSDAQLEKAYAKYQIEAKKKPSDKLKKLLLQLNNERKKRQKNSANSAAKSSSDLTALISKADKSDKTKRAKQKKKDQNVSQKLRKTSAPAISQMKSNIMLGLAFFFGALGLFLILDSILLSLLPFTKFKLTIGIVMAVPACVCAKLASYLSDDNR
jgi:hypothetical protein